MILVLLVNHYSEHRGAEEAFGRRHRDLERLKPLFEHVDREYANPITVDDAAGLLHMSRSSFMRFFKQVTGEPFVEWLHQLRVAKAQALLLTTDRSLSEIGAATGFCDQSYFGSVFKRLVGQTPREYRQDSLSRGL
jgi:AraC-like DNA-binding protein